MSSIKKKIFVCNLIITFMCLASILCYFILPFWKVDISYKLTAETIESISSSLRTEEDEMADNFLGSAIDALAEEIDKAPYTLTLSISLDTKDILNTGSASAEEIVETILRKNINDLMAQVDKFLDHFVPIVLKSATKSTLTNELVNQMKEQLQGDTTTKEALDELENMGINEEYINEKTDALIDAIYADNATPETVAEDTIDIVKEVLETLRDSGNEEYADAELSDEDEEELRNTLIEVFENFESQDGTLNPDAFTTELFLILLKGTREMELPEEDKEIEPMKKVFSSTGESNSFVKNDNDFESSENNENVKEELENLILDALMDALKNVIEPVAIVFTYLSKVILFTMIIWALPVLKILLKIGADNNSVKFGLPIWFGSLPFIVLQVAPTIAMSLAMEKFAVEAPLLSTLSINFFSCSIVSFCAGTFLSLFCIFYYGRLRRKLRKTIKQEKTLEHEPEKKSNKVVKKSYAEWLAEPDEVSSTETNKKETD